MQKVQCVLAILAWLTHSASFGLMMMFLDAFVRFENETVGALIRLGEFCLVVLRIETL